MHRAMLAGAACLVMAGSTSIAQAEVVINSGNGLSGANYTTGSTCTSGCSAVYTSPNAVITTSDTVPSSSSGANIFNDTATVGVNNAYEGAALGTLNSLLTAGTAGNVSFNLVSATNTASNPANFYAYWNVELTNPTNGNTAIINAYSDNTLGTNNFNQGSSTSASAGIIGGTYESFFTSWSTVAADSESSLGICAGSGCSLALGSWDVSEVTISVGGWSTDESHVDTISSISLPGTVTATPLPGAFVLFGTVLFGGLGASQWRKGNRARSTSVLA